MSDSISLTDADQNRSIKVPRGAVFSISLKENPTTGFNWQLQPFPKNLLALDSDHYALAAESGVGGGGIRRFQFRAVSAGSATIRLRYRRAWEPASRSAREFTIEISVE